MTIKHQYTGFLDSRVLWNDISLFGLSQFNISESDAITATDTDLPIHIPANEVLGKRIEHFFEYYIHSNSKYNPILKNLQIFNNKITIGELDFLVNDRDQNQTLHIELIYKFYIYDPKTSKNELERWIGPNRKDSLLEKVTKLKEKQLPLLHHPETIFALEQLAVNSISIKQQVCFLGNLFIPLSYKNKIIPHLNNKCIVGFWIHSEEFISEKYGRNFYYIPQKKDWIVDPKHNTVWYTFELIFEQLKIQISKKKSPLLWIKNNEDSFSKCFIVWW